MPGISVRLCKNHAERYWVRTEKKSFFSVPPGMTCGACRATYGRKSRKTFGQLLMNGSPGCHLSAGN
ncbi:Uncharacterized protein dnm_074500 [Desulfonema magnum]|uniref:Uncharacterized protein n=1 Tax=Desulfonema magnum TaxID=45655 RepID=A0A975BU95_9BACT|nr:Uncharacterized protein dnm_074500 [Desulfonema magnum]